MPFNVRITFHNMDHSAPLEAHAKQKLVKLEEMLREHLRPPFFVELRLTAHKTHPHHGAELHLKVARLDLNSHDEGTDLYVAVDNAIDKMVRLVNKDHEKGQDKTQKAKSERKEFTDKDDKYTLGD